MLMLPAFAGAPSLNRVHHCDALTLLRALPDASVDLVLTDPPYNIGKASWDSWPSNDAFIAWLDVILREYRRVLKPNGSLYLFCATKLQARTELAIEKHFNVLTNIRWEKPPFSTKAEMNDKSDQRNYFPVTESCVFAEQYAADPNYAEADYLFWARTMDKLRFKLRAATESRKDDCIAIYAADGRYTSHASIRVNAGRQWGWLPNELELMTEDVFSRVAEVVDLPFSYREIRLEHEDLRQEYEDLRRPFYATEQKPYTDVWHYKTVNTYPGKHICEKPLDMMRDVVEISSRPGDVVLDTFAGSGNSLRAAKELGRSWLGCDTDLHWVTKANRRIDAPIIQQLDMFAA